jgi:hypothetical protein
LSILKHTARRTLTVFVVHGRKPPLRELRSWLERRPKLEVELRLLEEEITAGDLLPDALSRVSSEGDAAIVLATAEDIGRLASDGGPPKPRMRQNVLFETGVFWGRLGRHRTALVIHGHPEIPTDLDGVFRIEYSNSLTEREPTKRLKQFFENLRKLPGDALTELVWASAVKADRERQWKEIHEAARHELVITGIAMGLVQQRLDVILKMLEKNKALRLTFVVVDPTFALIHKKEIEKDHRPHAVTDNHSFFAKLATNARLFRSVADRVEVCLYRGIPSFAAVVADGPSWGSPMVTQVFLPRGARDVYDHPRIKLKRRAPEGVYMTYWAAIRELIRRSRRVRGAADLQRLAAEVANLISP